MSSLQEWSSLTNLYKHQVSTLKYLGEQISALPDSETKPGLEIISDTIRLLANVEPILERWHPSSPSNAASGLGSSVRKLDPRATSAFKTVQDIVNSAQQSLMLAFGLYQSEKLYAQEKRLTRVELDVAQTSRSVAIMSHLLAAGRPSLARDRLGHELEQHEDTGEASHGVQDQTTSDPDHKTRDVSAAKGSASKEEFFFRAEVEFDREEVEEKVTAVLDHESDVEMVSKRFLPAFVGKRKIEEVLKPREHRGRRGASVWPKERIQLTWRPKGSTKSMTTDFLVDEENMDFDILLGKSWVDLNGIFTDIEVETLKIRLPSIIIRKSRSQREREEREREDERRQNEELQEQQREADRLERQLRMSGGLPVSPGNTTSSASSGQANTAATSPSTVTPVTVPGQSTVSTGSTSPNIAQPLALVIPPSQLSVTND